MGPDEIYSLLRRQPFEPFAMRLHDGRTFDVSHPEMLMVGRRWMVLGQHRPIDGGSVEDWVFLNPMAVASIHPMKNGRGRRRGK